MIYTLTFNPSIDYFVSVKHFKEGKVNRAQSESILPGGKGINVSIVLNHLGVESIPLGFIAGFTGREIQRCVTEEIQGEAKFINVNNGYSRINFKMKSDCESEVNGNGPHIGEEHIQMLYHQISQLNSSDILVLSGSIPQCISNKIYCEIMDFLADKHMKVIVDATGDLLMNVLGKKPFLIKPNNHELAEMFHVKLSNLEDIVFYAKELQRMGAQNVVVSMAKEGAILVCENGKVYRGQAPQGVVKNSVGAGDSLVAGFIAGYIQSNDYVKALQMGMAAGSASAFSENLASREDVEKLIEQITINEVTK